MADSGFALREYCIVPFKRGEAIANRDKRSFNFRLSQMRVRVEHLFGRMKARWRFLLYVSRLKTGEKNVAIIESIFVLNNILVQQRDNGMINEYLDPEDINIDSELESFDDQESREMENQNDESNTELAKGKRKRNAILAHLKRVNKLYAVYLFSFLFN